MVAMRVVILAPGSRGDVQPYLALAQGLRRAGHQARLVTTIDHEALVRWHGFEVATISLSVEAALREQKMSAAMEGGGVLSSFRQIAKLAKQAARETATLGLEACRDADVVVTGFSAAVVARAIATRLEKPLVQAFNVPLTPTAAYAGALFPTMALRGLSHQLTRAAIWVTGRTADEACREVLGAKRLPMFPPAVPGLVDAPLVYGFSEHFLPRGPEWPASVEVTGFWFADEAASYAPPPGLQAFLDAGPAPVCVGFGSMSSEDPARTVELVLEAAKVARQRLVLLSGWAGLEPTSLPADVFVLRAAPHDWLYPRCRAVVHHGGAGTTAAALRAGVPAVVVPFHGDQPFWGARVAAAGTGPAPIPKKQLTVARLAQAMTVACADEPMRAVAAGLSRKLAGEDGVARAVAAIERHASTAQAR
jgi:UDP:flavonoid glycosyltransferase YjiC (YdhE family)